MIAAGVFQRKGEKVKQEAEEKVKKEAGGKCLY